MMSDGDQGTDFIVANPLNRQIAVHALCLYARFKHVVVTTVVVNNENSSLTSSISIQPSLIR